MKEKRWTLFCEVFIYCSMKSVMDTKLLEHPPLTSEQLGARWDCHPKSAQRKMIRLGIAPIRLSRRSVHFRMIDVIRVETDCMGKLAQKAEAPAKLIENTRERARERKAQKEAEAAAKLIEAK